MKSSLCSASVQRAQMSLPEPADVMPTFLPASSDTCLSGESVFATNVVFEPLLGELFRSNLVQQIAAQNGDFVTPTVIGAGEYDYSQRDLRWTQACFGPLTSDKEFADHNKAIMDQWLSTWVPRCLVAARELSPLWSQPDAKPPRFEDGLDRAKSRFSGILSDINLPEPKELKQ